MCKEYDRLYNKVSPDMEFIATIANKAVESNVKISLEKTMLGGIPNLEITLENGNYKFVLIPVSETKMCSFYVINTSSNICSMKDTMLDVILELIVTLGKHRVKGKYRMKYAYKLDKLLKNWGDHASEKVIGSWMDNRG